MKCPACGGKGFKTGFGCPGFKPIKVDCSICGGRKELPDDVMYNPIRGEELKVARLAQKKTMRQLAIERGVSVVVISEQERGYFRGVACVLSEKEG